MTIPETRTALAAAEKAHESAQVEVDVILGLEWSAAILGVIFGSLVSLWLLPAFVVACVVMIGVRVFRSEPREKTAAENVRIHKTALQYEETLEWQESRRNVRVEGVSGTYERQVPWKAWG